MKTAVQLPGSASALPPIDATFRQLDPPGASPSPKVGTLCEQLTQQIPMAHYVLGGETTPAPYWVAAARCFPDAEFLISSSVEGKDQWRSMANGNLLEPGASAGEKASSSPAPASQPAPRPSAGRSLAEQILHEAFLKTAWGPSQENLRVVEACKEKAARLSETHPDLLPQVFEAIKEGEQAYEAAQILNKKLYSPRVMDEEFHDWFDALLKGKGERFREHLRRQLSKKKKRFAAQRKKGFERKSSLTPLKLGDAPHPNSLRHQPPCDHWEVMIDETGCRFELDAKSLPLSDTKLGKVVALAVPVGKAKLPPLDRAFHATDAPHKQLDEIMARLLSARVGIFGISAKDPSSVTHSSWFTMVHHLMRWVLRLLPVPPEKTVKVAFKIEERHSFTPDVDLKAIIDLLEAELKELSPERFGRFRLSAEFIRKTDHPLNGYVDVLAHTWGSPAAASRDRLKKAALLGHCFLRPADEVTERLYHSIQSHQILTPTDWCDAVQHITDEPPQSLLRELMDKLGQRLQENASLWQKYLNEIRARMHRKEIHLAALAASLDWLEQWCPESCSMPDAMKLHWYSAKLATANHFGRSADNYIAEVRKLRTRLYFECAPEVCEVDLRIAVAATNFFEFQKASAHLRHWQKKPVAECGLLAWSKVQSSLGQHLAFQHQPERALPYFDQALNGFARLSDKVQAHRESAQTRIFKMIALLDSPRAENDELAELLHQLIPGDLVRETRKFAGAGDEKRYRHHLLLRTMIQRPELTAGLDTVYLEQEDAWQFGETHPWPLINSYRAWLCHRANRPEVAASLAQRVIEDTAHDQSGPIIRWIGHVFAVLFESMHIALENPPETQELANLKAAMPRAPFDVLSAAREKPPASDEERLHILDQCLPFNFH